MAHSGKKTFFCSSLRYSILLLSTLPTATTTTMTDHATPTSTSTSIASSPSVRMIELVSSDLTVDGSRMSCSALLKLMDLCTCACAERHTHVNCVTVSMSDVVFENYPQVGDVLELVARPVLTGRTSLDIALTVSLERNGIDKQIVCEASFVYVTVRGPEGEKRFVPPLPRDCHFDNERSKWETLIAQNRRNLLKIERDKSFRNGSLTNDGSSNNLIEENNDGDRDAEDVEPPYDLESREVVLPYTQNHMDHTFGGQVMAWMTKAVMAVASRKARRKFTSLIIRSILRLDFATGSATSDHLILRTRMNAVFDQGRSAEVEVRVNKQCLKSQVETNMNTGYFFVSGAAIGTGTDIPFSVDDTPNHSSRLYRQAEWRRTQLLLRRQLLGGLGEPIRWHASLQREAPELTIKSLLRLVHFIDDNGNIDAHTLPGSNIIQSINKAKSTALGRKDTLIISVKAAISGYSLHSLLKMIRDERPKWDEFCLGIQTIKKEKITSPPFPYDIVIHRARSPKQFGLDDDTEGEVQYCLLRTWKVDESTSTAIFSSQSVSHDDVVRVKALGRVLPSGWFLRQLDDEDTIHVNYIAEHDLTRLRYVTCKGDDLIAGILVKLACNWIEKLQSMKEAKG